MSQQQCRCVVTSRHRRACLCYFIPGVNFMAAAIQIKMAEIPSRIVSRYKQCSHSENNTNGRNSNGHQEKSIIRQCGDAKLWAPRLSDASKASCGEDLENCRFSFPPWLFDQPSRALFPPQFCRFVFPHAVCRCARLSLMRRWLAFKIAGSFTLSCAL